MTFELTAQKLVYGGEALGHHDGRPVFVPLMLPGERARVEVVRTAKGVAHARPREIIAASPERVEPPCRYVGRCGGCQYQHLRVDLQPSAKLEILRETLRRIGKINWESEITLRAASPWKYRNQAQLKIARQASGELAMGFFESESHLLVAVDACAIISPRLNQLLGELRTPLWLERLSDSREIDLFADDRDERVMVLLRGANRPDAAEAIARNMLETLPGVVSVAFESDGQLQSYGESALEYQVGEFRYRISPGSFFQVSRDLLPELVKAVAAAPPGRLALDLYAGVGLFTLPLARHFEQVIGVEAAPSAAADLAMNAQAHSFTNLRAAGETAFDFLRRFAQAEPDLVVMDPPRAGVELPTLKFLADCRPRRIHYLSCSPPTLARDLDFLVRRGYHINSIDLFDIFPQTYHIESLVKLARSDLARP